MNPFYLFMMNSVIKKSLFLFLAVFCTAQIFGQHIQLTEGSVGILSQEKTINFEFAYDNMKVGKYEKEEDFVTYKRNELNKKEEGRGDGWAKKWIEDRAFKFEPAFEEAFQKSSGLTADVQKNSKYTLMVHTIFTEPGFSAGWPVRKSAEISAEVMLVETADKNKVLARISLEKAPGGGYGGFDFDTSLRLTAAYAAAGKSLGRFIKGKF